MSYTSVIGVNMLRITASCFLFTVLSNLGFADGATLTQQDFSTPGSGTNYTLAASPAGVPDIIGPDAYGYWLRMHRSDTQFQGTEIVFDNTATGPSSRIVADFDFRVRPLATPADGFSFVLLDTSVWGTTGRGPTNHVEAPIGQQAFFGEEPNIPGAFALGFDFFESGGIAPEIEPNANHLSLHYDGQAITTVADPGFNIVNPEFNSEFSHATVDITYGDTGALVSVAISPRGGAVVTPFANYFVPGMTPSESRVAFYSRSGIVAAEMAVANINVEFVPVPEASSIAIAGVGVISMALFLVRRCRECS